MDDQIHKAMLDKKPIPEIDFTLHIMEDGSQVSTQERVCKGIFQLFDYILMLQTNLVLDRCPSPRDAAADRRTILFTRSI